MGLWEGNLETGTGGGWPCEQSVGSYKISL